MSQGLSLDADVSALEKLNVIESGLWKNGGICMIQSETCFESDKVKVNMDVPSRRVLIVDMFVGRLICVPSHQAKQLISEQFLLLHNYNLLI